MSGEGRYVRPTCPAVVRRRLTARDGTAQHELRSPMLALIAGLVLVMLIGVVMYRRLEVATAFWKARRNANRKSWAYSDVKLGADVEVILIPATAQFVRLQ